MMGHLAADPYPWPYDGRLDPTRLALVIAGDQPAWSCRSAGAHDVAAVIDATAAAVRAARGRVVHIRHARHHPGPGPLPPARGTPGWQLASPAEVDDLVVDSAGVDGFFGSALDSHLRAAGVDTLVLAGYGAEAAVSSTLRSANDRGYECLTLDDGVAPFDAFTGRHSLSSITMSGGIFGAVASSAELIAALGVHPLAEVST